MDELHEELRHLEPNCEARPNYVARGLPERTCLGFITDDPLRFLFNLGRTVASDNIDTMIYAAFQDTEFRRDMMGRKQIVYFPDIEVEMSE